MKYLNGKISPKSFNFNFGQNLGVDGALKFLGTEGEFFAYHVPLPLCRKLVGDCTYCEGTGKSKNEWKDRCLRCFGLGVQHEYDYTEIKDVTVSFGFMLELMRFPEAETTSFSSQLLVLHTSYETDRFYVGGEYSVPLVDYLKSRLNGPIPEMVDAMISASEMMEGRFPDTIDRHQFQTYTQSGTGWLNVGCPGQACGLNPHHHFSGRAGEGYQFGDHNVDQPMQQMMLVASLASLHDLSRKVNV